MKDRGLHSKARRSGDEERTQAYCAVRRGENEDGAKKATRSKVFAVAGNPIFHSKSPLMFNTAFRELAIDAHYVRLAASTAEDVMITARQIGIAGLNITAPFKADALGLVDEVEEDARKVGSINTIVRRDGAYVGYNTDVAGVAGAVRGSGFDAAGQKAVVIGAGGAGRAAALALIRLGSRVTIVNRTFEHAREAAHRLGCEALPLDRAADALAGARLLVSAVTTDELLIEPALLSKDLLVLEGELRTPLRARR